MSYIPWPSIGLFSIVLDRSNAFSHPLTNYYVYLAPLDKMRNKIIRAFIIRLAL